MTIEQLTGRYLRLKQELEIAYRRTPWHAAHIDRLANDLSAIELELGRGYAGTSPSEFPPLGTLSRGGPRPVASHTPPE